MMLSGVFRSSSKGRAHSVPTTMMNSDAAAVSVIQFPIVLESASLSFAPKYWDTITPAPTEIPTKSTSRRFMIGLALPTAASALSPTYLPTTMLSTVL